MLPFALDLEFNFIYNSIDLFIFVSYESFADNRQGFTGPVIDLNYPKSSEFGIFCEEFVEGLFGDTQTEMIYHVEFLSDLLDKFGFFDIFLQEFFFSIKAFDNLFHENLTKAFMEFRGKYKRMNKFKQLCFKIDKLLT